MVGNPPFLGGKFISGRFGADYRSFLVKWIASGRRGHADLVAYFFLRGAEITRRLGFIATNTIGQGDTREVALDALLDANWKIGRAEKSRVWPGVAKIQVAEVWCYRECSAEPSILSGQIVPGISPLLVPKSRSSGIPFRLAANSNIAFIGNYLLGLGFVITSELAMELIDSNSVNRDVIFPYFKSEDICDRPDLPARQFVINFEGLSESEAANFPQCFERIKTLVRPERQRSSAAVRACPWWLHWRTRPALRKATNGIKFTVVIPRVSKYSMPMRLPVGPIYSDMVVVFASESLFLYGLLSSAISFAWSHSRGSTVGSTPHYTPTDCFQTLPFPEKRPEIVVDIASIITKLHHSRLHMMRARNEGVTTIYNRMHSAIENDTDIEALRNLHRLLDVEVLQSYGWNDIELDHGFRPAEDGLRFTVSETARIEILDRLLELNHVRHAEEVVQGAALPRKSKPTVKSRAKMAVAEQSDQELLEL